MLPKNNQDKNEETKKDSIQQVKNFLIKFEFTKGQLSLAILIGAISLYWYTVTNRIPFPVSLTELPATALLLLLLALVLFLVFVLLLNVLVFPIRREYKLSQESKVSLTTLVTDHGAIFFILMFGVPIVLTYSFLIGFFQRYWIISTLLILASICTAVYKYMWGKYKFKVIIQTLFRIVTLLFWVAVVIFVTGMFLLMMKSNFEDIVQIIIFYSMLIIPLFIYYMAVKINLKPLSIRQLFDNHIIFIIAYLVFLIFPTSSDIISASLKLSKLGGGYRTVYTFNDDLTNVIPDEYKCKYSQVHRSVPLYVILSIGDNSYVKLENNLKAIPFAIPKKAIVGQYFLTSTENNKGNNIYDCSFKDVKPVES